MLILSVSLSLSFTILDVIVNVTYILSPYDAPNTKLVKEENNGTGIPETSESKLRRGGNFRLSHLDSMIRAE